MDITDPTGATIGRVTPTKLAERATGSSVVTYTAAFSATVLNQSGVWSAPGGVRHYPTADAARDAILTARTTPAPKAPSGLRLGSNQRHALWAAHISDGVVEDRHGAALTKKGLAVDNGIRYLITDQGRETVRALFDDDGNPR